jgi:nuclear GTP-binding protein
MLQQKHNVLRNVKEHHRKISKEAKKEDRVGGLAGGRRSRDTGIPNE